MIAEEAMYFLLVQCLVISLLTSTAQGKPSQTVSIILVFFTVA